MKTEKREANCQGCGKPFIYNWTPPIASNDDGAWRIPKVCRPCDRENAAKRHERAAKELRVKVPELVASRDRAVTAFRSAKSTTSKSAQGDS